MVSNTRFWLLLLVIGLAGESTHGTDQRSGIRAVSGAVMATRSGTPRNASARVIEISPSDANASCDEEFEKVANALQPGDQLVLHAGAYTQSCRRAIQIEGTADRPIVIRAAPNEAVLLTRPLQDVYEHNNLEIVDSSYVILQGLRFRGGSTGIRFAGSTRHITVEHCEIYETGNNAITLNSGNSDDVTVRYTHIHHTGLSRGVATEGEGIYAGCNNDTCRVTNSVFEFNYIHHLRGTSEGGNDGIEVKPGSGGNVIRNNVIHDNTLGSAFPCIFVYGDIAKANVVEGNALWNCGEGIQVVSDAVVRNNLILHSRSIGINAIPHVQVPWMRNVTIVNNTIYGHSECVALRWMGGRNMVLANNAIYCSEGTAVDAEWRGGIAITIRANRVAGRLLGAALDGVHFLPGGSAETAFAAASDLDLWPATRSALRGSASPSLAPMYDFNGSLRVPPFDVGAYETGGLGPNPGWRIQPGFKGPNPLPPPALRNPPPFRFVK